MSEESRCCAVPLLERLRRCPRDQGPWTIEESPTSHRMIPAGHLAHEAANLIEQQAAEIDRLRATLENIATADPRLWDEEVRDQFREWAQNRARDALQESRG